MRKSSIQKRPTAWKLVGTGVGVLFLGLLAHDVQVAGQMDPPKKYTAEHPYKPPPDILDPKSAAIHPRGKLWEEYLKTPPLRLGDRAPSLTVKDHREKVLHLPTKQVPSVWLILCGCRDCAQAGHEVFTLKQDYGKAFSATVFVSNTSPYVRERMHGSFGFCVHVVWDRRGEFYNKLRLPSTQQYSHLPQIWGIDKNGIVRFTARPKRFEPTTWILKLRNAIGVTEPVEPELLEGPDP